MRLSLSGVLLALHVLRGDPQATFHSPVCTIITTRVWPLAIGHMVVEKSAPGLHPCSAIFAVFAHFTLGISRVKAMGEKAVSAARYVATRLCHTALP